MMSLISDALDECPIIAAIKNDDELEECINCDCRVTFVLYGNINTISEIVKKLKEAGKIIFVHADLIEGLSAREAAVDYLINNTQLDGIISTKLSLLRFAKAKGLCTVMRFFMIDSMALENIKKLKSERCIDMIEVMPGIMPQLIHKISTFCGKRIIAGGLVSSKSDVMSALDAGAAAVSSTNTAVWKM